MIDGHVLEPKALRASIWQVEAVSNATTALAVDERPERDATSLAHRPKNYSNYALLCEMLAARRAWGDRGPSERTIAAAHALVDRFAMVATVSRRVWINPHVPASVGGVVLEWWRGPRKLTIDVNSDLTADYTKVWGADIDNEMEDGRLSGTTEEIAELWSWLTE